MALSLLQFCEHQTSPLGVQSRRPRFSWRFEGDLPARQTAYRITVSTQPDMREADMWNSGWVVSGQSVAVVYNGRPLLGKSAYYWQVSLRCGSETAESGIACFETAIFEGEGWHAAWVSHPAPPDGYSVLLRKTFTLPSAPLRARAYICGLGLYRLHINGQLASNRVLEPAWTNYAKTVLYSVLDVTPYLQAGSNTVMIELGKGTYGQHHTSFKVHTGKPGPYVELPRALMDLDIFTPEGLFPIYTQPESGWHASLGDIIENDLYDGELCDGRQSLAYYNQPDFNPESAGWKPAVKAAPPGGILRAANLPPIRVIKELAPVSVTYLSRYKCVVDFGQNFAGWVRLGMHGQVHKRVTLKHGEVLDERGAVSTDNLRDARAIDNYVLSGAPWEVYEPRFTYHGFRYVEITMEEPLEKMEPVGCVVNSDVTPTGTFFCGNPVLNGIQQLMLQTECANLHGIPDACAQRDERMAWLNDMTVRLEEAIYNFDMLLLYEKWMEDIFNEQRPDIGSIPDTAPYIYGGNPAYHVSSVYVLIPWFLYMFYGDATVLEKYYPVLQRYVAFLAGERGQDGLIGKPYYGDWVAPIAESILGEAYNALPANIPEKLITTGYLHYDCLVMQKAAALLGKAEDAARYAAWAAETQQAINAELLTPEGYYRPNSQGANAFPLFLGIVPAAKKGQTAAHLVQNVLDAGKHITTGNQTTKYLFEALDKLSENDLAFDIASAETYPSLGFMVKNGATTIWERWENEIGSSMNSHNQPMLGAYTSWFYKALGGLRFDCRADGLRTVTVAPAFVKKLPFVTAKHVTPKGTVSCHWEWAEGGKSINMQVCIPWNMQGELCVLAESISINGAAVQPGALMLEAGTHSIALVPKS